MFERTEGVKRFQVAQKSPRLPEIRVAKAEDSEVDVQSSVESEMRQDGDPDFEIQVEVVDEIPDLSSGRKAYVLSKVPVRLP